MKYSFFSIISSIIFIITSCSSQMTEEKLKEQYPDSIVKGMVHKTFEKYIDLDIKKISIERTCQNDTGSIYAEGKAISKEYPGREFTFDINYEQTIVGDKFSDSKVSYGNVNFGDHMNNGPIISIVDDKLMDITCDDEKAFKDSLRLRLTKSSSIMVQVKAESRNAVRLAYQNKTKVHFGMSEDEYDNSDYVFKKNFIDGLIGSGAIELCKPTFARNKFVGFEIQGTTKQSIDYNNVKKMATETHSRKLDDDVSFRFDSYETNYVCSLYNLQVYTQTDGANGESFSTITVYWNKYLKLYK